MKANTPSWEGNEVPQTPLQRASFLDHCVRWLTSDASPPPVAFQIHTTAGGTLDHPATHMMVQTHTEYDETRATCAFCGSARATSTLLANPFTLRCLVTTCAKCTAPAAP